MPRIGRTEPDDDRLRSTRCRLSDMAYGRSQEEDFRAPFDRNDDSGTFVGSLRTARKTLGAQAPVEVTRLLRRLRKDFDAIRTIDYFPGAASTDAEVA